MADQEARKSRDEAYWAKPMAEFHVGDEAFALNKAAAELAPRPTTMALM